MAAIVATSLATPAAQQPRSVFRAATDLVWFGVTVTDKRGNVVNGLTKEDFEVVEEDQKQVVSQFASGAEVADLDLHAGLMFDTSESMTGDIDVSRTAAIKFLNRLPDAKDLTLVDFDTEVRIGRFSQDDFPRLVERIRTRKSEGWTALYDAFGIYLAGAAENAGRTVLVAFTDGGDSRSKHRFQRRRQRWSAPRAPRSTPWAFSRTSRRAREASSRSGCRASRKSPAAWPCSPIP